MKSRLKAARLPARRIRAAAIFCLLTMTLWPAPARASMFQGETLDAVANALAWIVLFVVPVVAIAAFWIVHILPEKIAEKKQHPQAGAIQCLCLLSLVFGGLLWPIAWLWAYSKPVLYKMAYGTDQVAHGSDEPAQAARDEAAELQQLRKRITELETNLAKKSGADGGKA